MVVQIRLDMSTIVDFICSDESTRHISAYKWYIYDIYEVHLKRGYASIS